MDKTCRINLSYAEICVVAAFLGYEAVLGVEPIPQIIQEGKIKQCVKSTVKKLECKNIIRYQLDGVLFVKPEIRLCIECLCDADVVVLIATNFRTGKNEIFYVLQKDDNTILLEKINDDKYKMQFVSENILLDFLPCDSWTGSESTVLEKMLYEEVVSVQKSFNEFNNMKLDKLLRRHLLSDNSVQVITEILARKCGYLRAKVYNKEHLLYTVVFDSLVVNAKDQMLSVELDENNIVSFMTVEPQELVEKVKSLLSIPMKGSVSDE